MRKFRVRKFLNSPGYHSVAFVNMEISKDAVKCMIGDCSKVIELDFYAFEMDGKKNAVQKAKLLAETMANFATALEDHYLAGGSNY